MNLMIAPALFCPPPAATFEVPKIELILALGAAVDLLSPTLGAHQKRVAIIASNLATSAGLSRDDVARVLQAGLLHSVGAMSHENWKHRSETGARFLDISSLTRGLAPLVAHYRHPLSRRSARFNLRAEDILCAQILNLANFIDDSIDPATFILSQVAARRTDAAAHARANLDPALAAMFLRASEADSFWLDTTAADLDARIRTRLARHAGDIADLDGLQDFGRLYSILVDARSPFTATHSWGVEAAASAISATVPSDTKLCSSFMLWPAPTGPA